ncbi:hypothetical protein MRX96_033758 [Rhipicephalus microplus]
MQLRQCGRGLMQPPALRFSLQPRTLGLKRRFAWHQRVWRVPESKDPVLLDTKYAARQTCVVLIVMPTKQVAHAKVVDEKARSSAGSAESGHILPCVPLCPCRFERRKVPR